MLGEGYSKREVARHLNVAESTLRGWLRKEVA
jgi:transposase